MTQARGPAWSRQAHEVIVRLVGAGADRATDPRAVHRIRVNNGCALICGALNLVFTTFFIITGVWLMVAKQLVMLAVFSAAIALNHRGRFGASKLLLLVALNLSVVGSFIALGMQKEVSMLYAVSCLPLLMCELRERKLLIIGTALPAVFALLMVAASERFMPVARLSPHAQHILHLVLVLATFVALFTIMLFFVVSNTRSEARLRQAILDTRRLLDRVDQGIAWLDHRGALGAERSAIFNQWLGTPAVNTPFAECLERLDAAAGQAFALAWNGFLSGGTQVDRLSAQLPQRVTAANRQYSLRYKATLNGTQLEGVMVVMTDVTFESERAEFEAQRLRLEADLFEARKLEAVGQLASGIAHELNTPAQFVGDNIQFVSESVATYASLMLRYRDALTLTAAPEHAALMKEIDAAEQAADLEYVSEHVPIACERARDGVQRISKIVNAMKELSHPGHIDQRPGDLNRALSAVLIIAQNEYKYIADVETDFAELPLVLCHINDITQVFLNLLVNAAHAIASAVGDSGKRGTVLVRTRVVRNDTAVQIDVGDTGCGISIDVRHRVFDPFFTTKEVGKGTGQGLTIARSIVVDKHLGSLSFESERGKGTTFSIVLPVAGVFRASLELGLAQDLRCARKSRPYDELTTDGSTRPAKRHVAVEKR